MSYIVKIGTIEVKWNDNNPVPVGWVSYVGELPERPIWDAILNNIREMNGAELAAEQAAEDEKAADNTDLAARVNASLTRLDDIIANGPTYTNAQVRNAVVDMAQMLRAIIRDIRHKL